MKLLVVYYGATGPILKMACAAAAGAAAVKGAAVSLMRVPGDDGEREAGDSLRRYIPEARPHELVRCDALLFGAPSDRRGPGMAVEGFLEQVSHACGGRPRPRVAGVFTCTAAQGEGKEAALRPLVLALLQLGMPVAGLPFDAGKADGRESWMSYGVAAGAADPPSAQDLGFAAALGRSLARIALRQCRQAAVPGAVRHAAAARTG